MKKKKKGSKSITAVGAVIVAGLTPGIATGTPSAQGPLTEVELTAADAVCIGGEVLDLDELFAMVQIRRTSRDTPKVYGPPPVSIREAESQDTTTYQSIAEVYGPRPPRYQFIGPEALRSIASSDRQEAIDIVGEALIDYCSQMPNPETKSPVSISTNSDLISEVNMSPSQLQMLQAEIEDRFGVVVTESMLKQLGTLNRIANFIVTVVSPPKKD